MTTPITLTVVIEDDTASVVAVDQPPVLVSTVSQPLTVVTVQGPPGPKGQAGTNAPIFGEIPAGARNGVNTVFALANSYQPGTVAYFLNGLRGLRGQDYLESGASQITAIPAPGPLDVISVDYLIL